jgi:hypothetical protein
MARIFRASLAALMLTVAGLTFAALPAEARANGPWHTPWPRGGPAVGPGVPPPPCVALYPPAHYAGWTGLPAYGAFPGNPSPAYMGSLGYAHAPSWYRPNGERIGFFKYVFHGYSGVMVPW